MENKNGYTYTNTVLKQQSLQKTRTTRLKASWFKTLRALNQLQHLPLAWRKKKRKNVLSEILHRFVCSKVFHDV